MDNGPSANTKSVKDNSNGGGFFSFFGGSSTIEEKPKTSNKHDK